MKQGKNVPREMVYLDDTSPLVLACRLTADPQTKMKISSIELVFIYF